MAYEKLIPSRLAHRASQDKKMIHAILQESLFCTVSYARNGLPFSIPTGFCLFDNKLIIHGSVKSHFIVEIKQSKEACITTFLFDGLVLAGSALHHSVNYRSVVLFAQAEEITRPEIKSAVLEAFLEKYIPGRWPLLRPMEEGEVKATSVLAFDLENASVKMRSGPPSFEEKDYSRKVWTGVLPAFQGWGAPVPDPNMPEGASAISLLREA